MNRSLASQVAFRLEPAGIPPLEITLRGGDDRWVAEARGAQVLTGIGPSPRSALQAAVAQLGPSRATAVLADLGLLGPSVDLLSA